MKNRLTLCIYLATTSYIIMEIIKLWETSISSNHGIPLHFYLPFIPIVLGFIVMLADENSKN